MVNKQLIKVNKQLTEVLTFRSMNCTLGRPTISSSRSALMLTKAPRSTLVHLLRLFILSVSRLSRYLKSPLMM